MHSARLYGITDLGYVRPEDVEQVTEALCRGGVDVLQLRAKGFAEAEVESLARRVLSVTRAAGVPLVVNDFPRVAAAVGSEGVHIGQDDGDLQSVRQIVGEDCWIGRSTHSLAQARAAAAEGVDYIGFGPLYVTGTKPGRPSIGLNDVAQVNAELELPVFCIGGVQPDRLDEVLAAGARRVVIVSALLTAPDIESAVREIKTRLPALSERSATPLRTERID
ncbi:MAG: thiamine phosphate synthase [Verrucomicrobiales bacterium]|nr:thiamine phosphate synthase [Verrucomicrobiales bacterium]